MSNFEFPFGLRQAMQLAMAVAAELIRQRHEAGGYCYINPSVPRLLSVRQGESSSPLFHFEGGISVRPHMVDVSRWIDPCWTRLNWAGNGFIITHATVRYWPDRPGEGEKVEEDWGPYELEQLMGKGWGIFPIHEVKGSIAVFFNSAENDWYLEVDPTSNQEGYYHSLNFPFFTYRPLVPGDLKRAEARAYRLTHARFYGKGIVAIYKDSDKPAIFKIHPDGVDNKKPLKQIFFDPNDAASLAIAMEEARSNMSQL
jgi:hypothetical protein